jgi:CRP-like cAMP-binding protein/membrane protein YdbS with pleckstrin-like domain
MADATIEERLNRFPLFRDFSQDELAQVGQFVEEKTFPSGNTVFRQGEPADFFYLVEEGAIQETGRDQAGTVILRRKAEAGDFVGRRLPLDNTPRRTTATVVRGARLLAIRADDFRTLLAMFPALREQLDRKRLVNRLLAIPLFSAFSREQLFQVADLLRVVEYPAGQTIFRQGEMPDAFYVIDTGQVRESVAGAAPGKQAWPKYLTAGSFFGRYSLLNNTARRATAEAVSDAVLFRFDVDAFRWLLQLQPAFRRALRRPDLLGFLRQTEVFGRLEEAELRHLAGFVGLARFRTEDILYRQGEMDPTFYILCEGEALVRARDEEERERPRGYLKAGASLGETSLFLMEPRDVTVEATTDTTWCYLTRQDFDQFLALRPEVAGRVLPRREVRIRRELRPLAWMEPEERLVFRSRRHWFFLAYRLSIPVILLLVALFVFLLPSRLTGLGFVMVVVSALWVIWRVIDWLNDYYFVTTSRVAHREKVLWIRESRDETPLDKVQNINVDRGLIGNLFGFGTLFIDTAATVGAARVTFTYLADPDTVQEIIFQQMTRVRAGEELERRQVIRDKLDESVGAGIHPTVPRPAVPMATPATPPSPLGPGLVRQILELLNTPFWIERREDNRVTWRKHWIRLVGRVWLPGLIVAILGLAVCFYLFSAGEKSLGISLFFVGLLLPALGWLWWNWVDWGNDLYSVTNDRIIDSEALPLGFRTRRTETRFDRIQNVSFDIPGPMAYVLNYGTVLIHTAGVEGRLDFVYVKDPRKVQAEIFRRLSVYEEEQRRLQLEERWADLPQWFAEYDRTYRS